MFDVFRNLKNRYELCLKLSEKKVEDKETILKCYDNVLCDLSAFWNNSNVELVKTMPSWQFNKMVSENSAKIYGKLTEISDRRGRCS